MRLVFACTTLLTARLAATRGTASAGEVWKADPHELLTAADCAKPHERADKLRLWTGRGAAAR